MVRFQLRLRQVRRIARQNRREYVVDTLESRSLLTSVVPAFSSLPGASHTIYLDFDGESSIQNTNWNSYYNQATLSPPAYDIDGDPSTFNSTELARIEEAWKRTAEDFRPFNVNVTTVDPGVEALRNSGGGDLQWGVRAIVTKESSFVTDPAERCGCGGIAYINSFNWSSDTPVWVYTSGGKSIAEAASHEAGHALGLSHDGLTSGTTYYSGHGSGDTGWAPIMGVGYYENVTQWDRGEYYNSNNGGSGANYGGGPDDLSIITTTNGFGYRADDHGDVAGNASALVVSGTSVSGSGIIETTTDVDVFTFTTGAGNVTLDIQPFTPGPNLDVKADLYDSSGNLVATSSPAATLNASFSLNLSAGQYYLQIDGTGVGNPGASSPTGYSDYASLGQYLVSGSIVDGGALPQISIGDVTVNEDAGTATFTVSVSGTVTNPVSVDYATANGSAVAGSDYSSASGSLTFASAGNQTVSVTILDDSLTEGSESFVVNLSNAAGAVITDGQGAGIITDNDTDISVNNVSANEGNLAKGKKNSGSPTFKDFVFTVSLSNVVSHTVTVDFSTADGSATLADNDFQSASGTVTFSPGETSKSVVVTVVGDNIQEGDEDFTVVLANATGGNIIDGSGTGTIVEDDAKGGGGSGGGGKGNGKPKNSRSPADAIVIADPFWYFEGPGDREHDHQHGFDFDHDHDHESMDGLLHGIHMSAFGLAGESPLTSMLDWSADESGQTPTTLRTSWHTLSTNITDSDVDSDDDESTEGAAEFVVVAVAPGSEPGLTDNVFSLLEDELLAL